MPSVVLCMPYAPSQTQQHIAKRIEYFKSRVRPMSILEFSLSPLFSQHGADLRARAEALDIFVSIHIRSKQKKYFDNVCDLRGHPDYSFIRWTIWIFFSSHDIRFIRFICQINFIKCDHWICLIEFFVSMWEVFDFWTGRKKSIWSNHNKPFSILNF